MKLIVIIRSGPFIDVEQESLRMLRVTLDPGQSAVIGRDPDRTQLNVRKDRMMSGKHFEVVCHQDHAIARDLDSTNGTFLNGERLSESRVKHRDQIRAGDSAFEIILIGAPDQPDAEDEPLPAAAPPSPTQTVRAAVRPPDFDTAPPAAESPRQSIQAVLKVVGGAFSQSQSVQVSRVISWIGSGQTLVVGRSGACDLAVRQDQRMSSRHFQIACESENVRLTDLNSSNGTQVNDEPIQEALLRDGDQIIAGTTRFQVDIIGAAELSDEAVAAARVAAVPQAAAPTRRTVKRAEEYVRIVNDTPATFARVMGKVNFPDHSLTLVAKMTFALRQGAPMEVADQQRDPCGARSYEETDESDSTIEYENDLVPFKPRADVIVTGHCHAPGGQPVTECDAGFVVGGLSRTIRVIGDRQWQGPGGDQMTAPEPFTKMPLRWQRAFGGPEYEANPVGCGCSVGSQNTGTLPNLEDPNQLIGAPSDRPQPVGFAPIPSVWKSRTDKAGKYSRNWLDERWPYQPTDFDWTFHNAAPVESQIDDYLRGNETVTMHNLHPEHSTLQCQLPDLRMRAFIDVHEEQGSTFRDVPMNLDTLWIQPDAEVAVLVWRGVTDVQTERLAEVDAIYLATESASKAPFGTHEHETKYRAALAAIQADSMPFESPEPATVDMTADAGAAAGDSTQAETESDVDQLKAALEAMRQSVRDAGYDPDNMPELGPEDKAERDRILAQWGVEIPAEEPATSIPEEQPEPWTRENFEQRIEQGESPQGENLSGINLAGADLAGVDFRNADLSGADLRNAQFSQAIFSGANLSHARLDDSQLWFANFHSANLNGASFERSFLNQADFTHADLSGATLLSASLEHAIFTHAMLAGADLRRVNAKAANLAKSNLSGATLSHADLTLADLSRAQLTDARCDAARLSEASLQGATAHQASFRQANLTKVHAAEADLSGASLDEVTADDSVWEEANLNKTSIRRARMHRANLIGAQLKEADLYGSDLRFARLGSADLADANLNSFNLFEGSLEGADLTNTDLRQANLYGVDLRDANLADANDEGANFDMTLMKS